MKDIYIMVRAILNHFYLYGIDSRFQNWQKTCEVNMFPNNPTVAQTRHIVKCIGHIAENIEIGEWFEKFRHSFNDEETAIYTLIKNVYVMNYFANTDFEQADLLWHNNIECMMPYFAIYEVPWHLIQQISAGLREMLYKMPIESSQ